MQPLEEVLAPRFYRIHRSPIARVAAIEPTRSEARLPAKDDTDQRSAVVTRDDGRLA